METKGIVFGIVGLVIAAGGAVVIYSFQHESLKTDVRRKKAEVAALEQNIASAKDAIDSNNAQMDAILNRANVEQSNDRSREKLEMELTKQTKLLETAKGKWELNAQIMQEALVEGRAAFRKEMVPEIPLKTGESLKSCQFSGVKDGMALFQHSDGMARLTAVQLPPALADRLRPSFNLQIELPPDPDVVVEVAPVPASPEVSADLDPIAAPPEVAPIGPSGQAVAIQTQINGLRTQSTALQAQKASFLEQARVASAKFIEARNAGRSSSQSALRDKAQASANTTQAQIDQIDALIRRLELDLSQTR